MPTTEGETVVAEGVALQVKPGPADFTEVMTERKFKPVKAWAFVGAAFLAVEIYALAWWLATGTRTPAGSTPVPAYMKFFIVFWWIVISLGLPVFLYIVLVKPWRRGGSITLDGLLSLAFLTIWWMDPMSNWFRPWITYNAWGPNLGNWTPHIPGWFSPNAGAVAEHVAFIIPGYCWVVFGMVMVGNLVMRKTKARWPHMSRAGVVGICFLFFLVFDAVAEPIWMMSGLYSYAGAIPSLTIFYGHYFQYPIYNGVLVAAWWTTFCYMRFYRNDRGETAVERGVSELKAGPTAKAWIRWLALVGALQSAFTVVFTIPAILLSLYATWPADITNRSYFTEGLCGPSTTMACPSPETPIPGLHSSRVGPSGQLVTPR